MNRRQFLLAAGATLASPAFAQAPRRLTIAKRQIEVLGRAAEVYGILDDAGKHGVFARAGERFAARIENRTSDPMTLHWHGQVKAAAEQDRSRPDGGAIPPGGSDAHDFELTPGTHWMHAHTLHEQRLLAAPMIAREADAGDARDVVVMLHDFSFKSPEELLAGLTGGHGGGHGGHGGGVMGMMRGMMGRHAAPHANDIAYDAYLANDRTLADPEVVRVERGGLVRLRLINAGTATAFFVDTGALASTLIAVDGTPCLPYSAPRYPIAQGQRLDLLVDIPREGGAFPVFAQVEASRARTGLVLATQGASIARLGHEAANAAPHADLALDAALRARAPLPEKAPDRTYRFVLGEGPNYEWTINGAVHHAARPVEVPLGARVELQFMNPSSMMHPMHLHGHHFQVVATRGGRYSGPVRDTVIVPPHTPVAVAVDFDKPGGWYLHCHHLYHMARGMMAEFHVA
ncbi:MAG: multicopper oxidase domain-containing protein [Tagaea sp.]|nr:multicopper oxidase domain-containing protein [Tagaea sp.]